MIPLTSPDFARRDLAQAEYLLRSLNPRAENYPLALGQVEECRRQCRESIRLWDEAPAADTLALEYALRKASRSAAARAAVARWKVDSFVRGTRYGRKKQKHAAEVAARTKGTTPKTSPEISDRGAPGPGAPAPAPSPVKTFREWRALAREEELRKADDARRAALADASPLVQLP